MAKLTGTGAQVAARCAAPAGMRWAHSARMSRHIIRVTWHMSRVPEIGEHGVEL